MDLSIVYTPGLRIYSSGKPTLTSFCLAFSNVTRWKVKPIDNPKVLGEDRPRILQFFTPLLVISILYFPRSQRSRSNDLTYLSYLFLFYQISISLFFLFSFFSFLFPQLHSFWMIDLSFVDPAIRNLLKKQFSLYVERILSLSLSLPLFFSLFFSRSFITISIRNAATCF